MAAVMLPLLLSAFITVANSPAPSASCAVKAQPKISLAPLRTTRIQVTVEPRTDGPWRQADLILVSDGMEIRSSRLWEGDAAAKAPRTTWVTWELPALPAGEYMVALVVQTFGDRCMASDKLVVQGEQP